MRLQRRITTAARCRTRYSSRRLVVGAKSGKTYSAATLSAFGEDLTVNAAGDSSHSPFPVPHSPFFTGKPAVEGLGHAFLMRNYRAGLAKWQTADPLGYPDGWNQLAYCNNGVTSAVDLWGCEAKKTEKIVKFDTDQQFWVVIPWFNSEWDGFGQLKQLADEAKKAGETLEDYVNDKLKEWKSDEVNEVVQDSLRRALIVYFSQLEGGDYSEVVPQDEWEKILSKYEDDGWTLEYGPKHTGLTTDKNTDIVNAGVGALIIEGCTHHWQAKFVKE